MADDSELDYIATFLGKIHTAATVKHIDETGKITNIADTQKMLLYPPEILGAYSTRMMKQYQITIIETSEANLTTALNNIQAGILKCNRRETITDFTKPSTWCYCELARSNKAFFNKKTSKWSQDVYLNVEWSIE